MKDSFKEVQRIKQWYILATLLIPLVILLPIFINQVLLGNQTGQRPTSNAVLIVALLVPVLMLYLTYTIKLVTCVNDRKLEIKLSYIKGKVVFLKDIKKARVINYSFVGFGYRIGTKYGTVFSMRGSKGVHIILYNNRKILLGSESPEALCEIINMNNSTG